MGDCLARSTLHIAGWQAEPTGNPMKQDDKGKDSSRQDRLKLALRENLKRRKSQARGRDRGPAPSPAAKVSLDDGNEEGSD
jgi:hypothetical protein